MSLNYDFERLTGKYKHPTPWECDHDGRILDAHGCPVDANVYSPEIVLAVNSHAKLLAACRLGCGIIVAHATGEYVSPERDRAAIEVIQEAIAEAEKQP